MYNFIIFPDIIFSINVIIYIYFYTIYTICRSFKPLAWRRHVLSADCTDENKRGEKNEEASTSSTCFPKDDDQRVRGKVECVHLA
jgi:hypothetical protein